VRSRSPHWRPATWPPPTACVPRRSCSALPTSLSASACPRAAVRETRGHARHEAASHAAAADHLGGHRTTRQIASLTSFREKALSAACQAGMVNNLNDGLAWGVFPLLFARHGLWVSQIGILAALYPAVWGAGQLGTGTVLSYCPSCRHVSGCASGVARAGTGLAGALDVIMAGDTDAIGRAGAAWCCGRPG